jgi:hypothetical protein
MPTTPSPVEVDNALRAVIAERTALNQRIADELLACLKLDAQIDGLLAMRTAT